MVLTTVYIAQLGLVYREFLQVLFQALAFIWCSVGKSQSKNEVSLQDAYYICCYEPCHKDT